MMYRKIIFIFTLFLVVVGIENVSFSSEDGVLYSRTVVKNGTEQDTSEYDIEYEDDEESEDDSYYNDSNKKYVSDAKSGDRKGGKKTEKKKITKKKVNKKTINNNRTLFKMFDVSFSVTYFTFAITLYSFHLIFRIVFSFIFSISSNIYRMLIVNYFLINILNIYLL